LFDPTTCTETAQVHFNLKILNLLLSISDASSDTPDVFRARGYQVEVVEPVIELSDGHICNPECLLVSRQLKGTIAVESKSGTGSSEDQLDRYEKLDKRDLLKAGLWEIKDALATVDKLFICPAEDAERQIDQLNKVNSSFSVLAYESVDGLLQLMRGNLSDSGLNSALRAGISVPWPPSPHDYIPFDANSSDIEIAVAIAPSMTAHALRRRKSFTSYDVCRDAIR
jgi:hypothetical protein